MSPYQKALAAMDFSSLLQSPNDFVERVEAEEYTDSMGEPSIRVQVILKEAVDVEKITGEMVSDLKRAIREHLRDQGMDAFPYIFLAKQSELDMPNDEEE